MRKATYGLLSLCTLVSAFSLVGGCSGCASKGVKTEVFVDSAVAESQAKGGATVTADTSAIRDFYYRVVLPTDVEEEMLDTSVQRMCGENLKKELRDAYEYDGDGYAVWLFRTCYNGDLDDSKGKVFSIEVLGDRKYAVNYLDMGIRGRTVLQMTTHDGAPQIDAIVKRDKGCDAER